MEKYCINCIYEREPAAFEPCLSCYPNKKQNFIQKPQTNADKIRQMSDEELAKWIARYVLGLKGGMFETSVNSWLDWLKQEAESDEL